jgi:hypothetical protein
MARSGRRTRSASRPRGRPEGGAGRRRRAGSRTRGVDPRDGLEQPEPRHLGAQRQGANQEERDRGQQGTETGRRGSDSRGRAGRRRRRRRGAASEAAAGSGRSGRGARSQGRQGARPRVRRGRRCGRRSRWRRRACLRRGSARGPLGDHEAGPPAGSRRPRVAGRTSPRTPGGDATSRARRPSPRRAC